MQKEYNYFEECFKDCRDLLRKLSGSKEFYLTLTVEPAVSKDEDVVELLIVDPDENGFEEIDVISGLNETYYFLLGVLLGAGGMGNYKNFKILKSLENRFGKIKESV